MAKLDAFIDLLFKEHSEALLLETGSAAVLVQGGSMRPVISRALTSQQVQGAVLELMPAYVREGFSGQERVEFDYDAPAGKVEVVFEPVADGVRATLKPLATVPAAAVAPASPPPVIVTPPPAPAVLAKMAVAQPKPAARAAPGTAGDAMRGLLDEMVRRKASDLHLTSGYVPCLRLDGDIVPLESWGTLTDERLKEMIFSITPPQNREQWEKLKDTDFAYETEESRFRVNVFADRGGIGAVLRRIPTQIISAEDMGLSKALLDLCFLHKGLVLVTGPTGSGKSTTLAAMIDFINRNREDHILTIEDPIEFVHPNKKCLVHQREVGVHTQSFKNALRAALREDPDIVLVGELRDLETISIALETAETGHLVFGTLHTNTAPSTVDRIIDQFPADRQTQVRTMLSESLKAVVAQTLCKKIGGGRAAAQEILICNSAVSNLIREGKTFQIASIMQTGRGSGMVTLNDALLDLVKRKVVAAPDALAKAVAKSELKAALEKLDPNCLKEAAPAPAA